MNLRGYLAHWHDGAKGHVAVGQRIAVFIGHAAADHRQWLEWMDAATPALGARLVARAWVDPAYRQRALAEWAGAAGFGLVAWGLGAEAPTRAEAQQNIEQQKDLLRERGIQVPATAGTTPMARRLLRYFPTVPLQVAGIILGVRSGLRHPRRLTVLAIAGEAPMAVFFVLRVPRAAQRRRPRMAVGSALVAAGSVVRLRAAGAEPLR